MKIIAKSMMGGQLIDLVRACMLRDDNVRKKFDKKAGKKPDAKPLAAFAKVYGWAPPAELAEWQAILPGYRACFYEISDVWMVGGGDLSYVTKKKVDLGKLINDPQGTITLLTGLERFGDDPSGDSSYVSTLPHEKDLAEVHVYDHETGEMDGTLYYSMGDFVVSCWQEEDEHAKAMKDFNSQMKPARGKWSTYDDPRALFNRIKWMWTLSSGEPSYHFAEDMDRAPSFADWEKEKSQLPKRLVLANYWMLAHYFLGNDAACREACEAVKKKAMGTMTPALSKMILALLDKPGKAKLGKLAPKQLDELRAAVRKNADERLLDPKGAAEMKAQRSAGVKKADAKDITKRLQAGEDGWALIAEFPDDTDAHAALLEKMGAKDKALGKFLEDFESQKTKDVYDEWPSKWDKNFDRKISPCVGALFRAGLAYDSDHKRACASFVRTLAWLDDDAAMDSFGLAIEKLRMDDARHEYLVAGLARSKHPRARELLDRAAWRFFDFFDATVELQKKRAARGPTLDDIFAVDSHLLGAVIGSIRIGDDVSEKLVDKVCSIRSNMSVLSTAYASAFKQVGQKKLDRHLGVLGGYCKAVDGFDAEFLPDYACYNLAEAALAGVKLSPDKAPAVLREMLEKKRDHLQIQLDIAGSVLSGLLFASPKDPELLKWTERILGNRTRQDRVYGALRGVAEAKVTEAREWCRYHVYAGASSLGMGHKPIVQNAARAALVALGEPEPGEFDSKDEYGNKLAADRLPDALLHPERHRPDNIFERIIEKKYVSPEVVRIAGPLLEDAFRYSADDMDPSLWCDERKEGLSCMIVQGEPALPMLTHLLDLPRMGGDDKTLVLYTMSVITNAPRVIAELVKTTNLLPLVEKTPAEMLGALDLVCGFARAVLGEAAKEAIDAAIRKRFSYASPGSDHWIQQEPTASRLIHLADKTLKKEIGKLDNHHTRDLIELANKAEIESVDGLGGAGTLTMISYVRPNYSDPTTTCAITVDGKSVKIGWKVGELHFQGIPKEGTYEQYGAVDFASAEDATKAADTIARALNAIGFAPPAQPKTKPKKKQKR